MGFFLPVVSLATKLTPRAMQGRIAQAVGKSVDDIVKMSSKSWKDLVTNPMVQGTILGAVVDGFDIVQGGYDKLTQLLSDSEDLTDFVLKALDANLHTDLSPLDGKDSAGVETSSARTVLEKVSSDFKDLRRACASLGVTYDEFLLIRRMMLLDSDELQLAVQYARGG